MGAQGWRVNKASPYDIKLEYPNLGRQCCIFPAAWVWRVSMGFNIAPWSDKSPDSKRPTGTEAKELEA